MTDGSLPTRETPAGVQAAWARLLLGSFADAGVRQVVVCPGSRSTPLVLAAAAEKRLHLEAIVDERSAAFYALGQARFSGQPSLLICTSGSAAANFWPAVVEAAVAEIPLLILTADRPVELQAAGANQTIDQLKLFGDYARLFVDLGMADAAPEALRGTRRLVAQAVATTLSPRPGPVHLNARARPPLEPAAATATQTLVGSLLAQPIVRRHPPRATPCLAAVEQLAAGLAAAERPLLVAGPAPLAAAAVAPWATRLARHCALPFFADSTSQCRFVAEPAAGVVDAFSAWLGQDVARREPGPDFVLQIGRAPTTTQWSKYLAHHASSLRAYWILAESGWPDADNYATDLLIAEVPEVLEELLERLEPKPPGPWLRTWEARAGVAEQALTELLALPEMAWSEGQIARRLVARLPEQALLMLGNSLAIREVDLYSQGRRAPLAVLSQRGASGIDGLLSGAIGAARLASRPTVVLIGDLSLHHDLNALALAKELTAPLVVVVVNNDGGRIFEHLPLASFALASMPWAGEKTFELWTTPQGRDFGHAAAHFGWDYRAVAATPAFEQALDEALARPRATLIEATVAPRGAVAQNDALRERLAQAVHEGPLSSGQAAEP